MGVLVLDLGLCSQTSVGECVCTWLALSSAALESWHHVTCRQHNADQRAVAAARSAETMRRRLGRVRGSRALALWLGWSLRRRQLRSRCMLLSVRAARGRAAELFFMWQAEALRERRLQVCCCDG